MNVIYNKSTGKILNAISSDQDYKGFYINYGEDFIKDLDSILVEEVPRPLSDFYVKEGRIVEYSEVEKEDIRKFGKIPTIEERLLHEMKPSREEIKEAEQTIKILTVLSGVM